MQPSTAANLKAVAADILWGRLTEKTPFCPKVVSVAIAVLAILKDREWHTSLEISESLGIGRKYVSDILKACSEAWGLESHRRNGWKLNRDVCPVCKAIYTVDEEEDHRYHECDSCGWHWVEKPQQ